MKHWYACALLALFSIPSFSSPLFSTSSQQPDADSISRALTVQEVQVTARRAAVAARLDMKVYAVASNSASTGGSLLDAMRSMPGITIDQEGKISIRGSDRVMILIDGRQSSLTGIGSQKGLDNIPASQIERIEIINNPSAKYDAAGMAGVVNIIYKKEGAAGFNGDASLALGVGNFTTRRADLPTPLGSFKANPKILPALNMNYKTPSVNVFANANMLLQERLPNNEFTTRYYDNGSAVSSQVAENRRQIHYNIKAGLDWQIDSRNTLTAFGVYDYEYHVDTSQVSFFELPTMNSRKNWSFNELEGTGYANGTLIHRYNFGGDQRALVSTLQFTRSWEDELYNLFEKSKNRTASDQTHVIAPENVWLANVDYSQSFERWRFEVGAKGQLRSMPITYNVRRGENSPIYEGLGNWSDWNEDIAAAYANFDVKLNAVEIEAGLRAEYTWVRYAISPENIYYRPTEDAYNYFDLFLSLRVTWRVAEHHRLSAFYNRRIDRPSEAELRIFPKYDDPEMLKVGNPYLRPQYTDNVELGYRFSWAGGSVYAAGYYKIINDAFTRIYAIDEQNERGEVINKTYQNTGRATNAGVEVVFEQKITPWWRLNASFNWYQNTIDGYTGTLYFPYERPFTIARSLDNPHYAKLNMTFNFWRGAEIQLSGQYYSAVNQVQGYQKARGGVDLGFKKPLSGGKVELSLSASDIFNTMGIGQQIRGEGFSAEYENLYETQIVMVGCKVKF